MRAISTDAQLNELQNRVVYHANETFGRTLPEMRFFILNSWEFMSLLEKFVYPVSPVNIWEGKRFSTRRHRVESGMESSLYYEVVQTGNPSYAYLNDTNSAMMQASVMAHVVGHCEFSELNVLKDSNQDRTEYIIYLVKKVNNARTAMGDKHYMAYWNAVESLLPLIAPHSQFNLARSVETESALKQETDTYIPEEQTSKLLQPHSDTLNALLRHVNTEEAWHRELQTKQKQEELSRQGYKLKAPCQDVLGFLRQHTPTSQNEQSILDYFYTSHSTHDFVIRTQIMNEGWAMYWEKKIMTELFKEKAVTGIIDYARTFSGVCFPRPFYQRNPYHMGFYLWTHIEELYREGKVSLDYVEETELEAKQRWNRPEAVPPIKRMENLVRTVTDYEFIRRFLNEELIEEFHLNRVHRRQAEQIGLKSDQIIRKDQHFVWVDPDPVKQYMLEFFTHFYRPRIYLIDTDFQDGGLLLFHRDDGRRLRKDWIKPTLKNINLIWKGPVSLVSKNWLYSFSTYMFRETVVTEVPFEQIVDRIRRGEKPIRM